LPAYFKLIVHFSEEHFSDLIRLSASQMLMSSRESGEYSFIENLVQDANRIQEGKMVLFMGR